MNPLNSCPTGQKPTGQSTLGRTGKYAQSKNSNSLNAKKVDKSDFKCPERDLFMSILGFIAVVGVNQLAKESMQDRSTVSKVTNTNKVPQVQANSVPANVSQIKPTLNPAPQIKPVIKSDRPLVAKKTIIVSDSESDDSSECSSSSSSSSSEGIFESAIISIVESVAGIFYDSSSSSSSDS